MTTKTKTNIEKLTFIANDLVRQGEHVTEGFAEKFAKDPAYALEWSGDVFAGAAKQDVGKTILHWLTIERDVSDEKRVNDILNEIRNQVQRGARFPHRSTSQASNEMAVCKLAALAEFLERAETKLSLAAPVVIR